MAKKRNQIPAEIAARVLFASDRTCCVCRNQGKPIQIHHIDENPSNNSPKNFAVLCFDCHRETQIRGGFDRKLDENQIILYREDWLRIIAQKRAVYEEQNQLKRYEEKQRFELITSIAEIYRENQEFELLSMHYNSIGNYELRDKFIELALKADNSDSSVIFLRSLQRKPELIPNDVIERQLSRFTKERDWSQRARLYRDLNKPREATRDYVCGISESLKEDNIFSAAFYLKELVERDLIKELFIISFRKAAEEKDLWWQVRALQELGWREELDELVLRNEDEIQSSDNDSLKILLCDARGDAHGSIELRKSQAENSLLYRSKKKNLPSECKEKFI
jgi:hypothetical protein